MSRNYKYWDQDNPHFISFAVVDWLDVFIRRTYCDILLDVIKQCQDQKGLIIYGWCIMTSHVHIIIGRNGEANQEHIIRDLKRTSSKRILRAIAENVQESRKEWMMDTFRKAGQKNSHNWYFQFWQQHNHPLEVTSKRKMHIFLTYIHRNPVVSGFVDYEQDYRYSSARDYCGTNGMLEIVNPFI